ncbi:hypothetical protein ON010_g16485 [Phytophthora cinnamomi]|nr:hypothetical protein ON010_g16485 [Phytophthora cinnamomi]
MDIEYNDYDPLSAYVGSSYPFHLTRYSNFPEGIFCVPVVAQLRQPCCSIVTDLSVGNVERFQGFGAIAYFQQPGISQYLFEMLTSNGSWQHPALAKSETALRTLQMRHRSAFYSYTLGRKRPAAPAAWLHLPTPTAADGYSPTRRCSSAAAASWAARRRTTSLPAPAGLPGPTRAAGTAPAPGTAACPARSAS